jgi:hypothetical protein
MFKFMIEVTNSCIVENVCGVLFRLSPYNKVPNIDEIVHCVLNSIFERQSDSDKIKYKKDDGIYSFMMCSFKDEKELRIWLKNTLFNCEAFKMLNVTPKEQKNGKTYKEVEETLVFVDRYSSIKQENEFVDLDAAVRNIINGIINDTNAEKDCFLCEFAKNYGSTEHGDSECCNYCINNWSENCKVKSYYKQHPYSLLPQNSSEYQQLVNDGKYQECNYKTSSRNDICQK